MAIPSIHFFSWRSSGMAAPSTVDTCGNKAGPQAGSHGGVSVCVLRRSAVVAGCTRAAGSTICVGLPAWRRRLPAENPPPTNAHRGSRTEQQDDRVLEPLIQDGEEAPGRYLSECVGAIRLPGGLHSRVRQPGLPAAPQGSCQAVHPTILLMQSLLVLVLRAERRGKRICSDPVLQASPPLHNISHHPNTPC